MILLSKLYLILVRIRYSFPKHLNEKVAHLHLARIGAELTTLSPEQAEWLGCLGWSVRY